MIHCRPDTPEPKSRWMVGSATFTTVLSSMAMNSAKHMVKRVVSLTLRSTANIDPPVVEVEA